MNVGRESSPAPSRRGSADLADPGQAVKTALRRPARRHRRLTEEIRDAAADLVPLVAAASPRVLALQGMLSTPPGSWSLAPAPYQLVGS